ncbi:MAG: T9SS type A sorting domain-containing protein [Bacteroidetes bacterium]|nr:T9SS type A sorting domain-containing protein [Bacteroidota bacterium]
MRKTVLLVCCLLICTIARIKAQQGIVASGGTLTGTTGGKASYTVGQVDYITLTGTGTVVATLGLQQPYNIIIIGIDDLKDIRLDFSVYPNPARNQLNIKVDRKSISGLTYQLYNLQGQLLINGLISEQINPIPMEKYAPSTYLLTIKENNSLVKSFKIIKNQ